MGTESSFPLVSGRNPDEMVSMPQINLGEKLGFGRGCQKVRYKWKGIFILLSDGVESLEIDT